MSDPNDLGIGGGLSPLGGPSLDEEEKAMKKGRGVVVAVSIVAGLALIGGLVFVLVQEDDDPYGRVGQQVNGMRADHFDRFWACALPNQRLDDLRNDQDLRYAITKRASSSPHRYAALVREQCMVKLREHEAPLNDLLPPEDLRGQIDALGTALDDLRGGWEEYLTALDQQEAYDEEALAPQLNKVAKGWFDYKTAHGDVNRTIRAHIE